MYVMYILSPPIITIGHFLRVIDRRHRRWRYDEFNTILNWTTGMRWTKNGRSIIYALYYVCKWIVKLHIYMINLLRIEVAKKLIWQNF